VLADRGVLDVAGTVEGSFSPDVKIGQGESVLACSARERTEAFNAFI